MQAMLLFCSFCCSFCHASYRLITFRKSGTKNVPTILTHWTMCLILYSYWIEREWKLTTDRAERNEANVDRMWEIPGAKRWMKIENEKMLMWKITKIEIYIHRRMIQQKEILFFDVTKWAHNTYITHTETYELTRITSHRHTFQTSIYGSWFDRFNWKSHKLFAGRLVLMHKSVCS